MSRANWLNFFWRHFVLAGKESQRRVCPFSANNPQKKEEGKENSQAMLVFPFYSALFPFPAHLCRTRSRSI